MWSIPCNIQHLAQQQGQHKIQWSMHRKRTFRQFRRLNTANCQSYPHDDIIKRIKARVAWGQKGSEHWHHCIAYDPKRNIRQRKDGKRTLCATKTKRNQSRSMWIERPQWQECEFKSQRQQLCNSRMIWEMLKRHDRQLHSLKQHLARCWMLSETVWAILQVPTMRRMGKTRMIMKKIQSLASWVKMINLAGWWAQSQKRYSTTCRAFGRSRWGLTNWCNRDGGKQWTTLVREIWSTGRLNLRLRQL